MSDMFDNIRKLLLDSISRLISGGDFDDLSEYMVTLPGVIWEGINKDLQENYGDILNIYTPINNPLVDAVISILSVFQLVTAASGARLAPMTTHENYKAFEKWPAKIPEWTDLLTSYQLGYTGQDIIRNLAPYMGYNRENTDYYMGLYSNRVNIDLWINNFRYQNNREPLLAELNSEYPIAIDQYDEHLIPLRKYPGIDTIIKNWLFNNDDSIVTQTSTDFDNLIFGDWNPEKMGELSEQFIKYGYDNENIYGYLDSFFSYPDPQTIVKVGCMWGWSEQEIQAQLLKAGVHPWALNYYSDIGRNIADPMSMVRWLARYDYNQADMIYEVEKLGVHPFYSDIAIENSWQIPTPDILSFIMRRLEYTEDDISLELSRLGVHPSYKDIYQENTMFYPSVNDLILMSVREVFDPEIVEFYGQGRDFPDDFAHFASKAGLSEEWARKYWMAHWQLPSPQQGYEMLHRGVIDETALRVLLRTLDVMPYWREKLMAISYLIPGRIDIRRMYGLGVYALEDVFEQYLNLGYDSSNAESLTTFTHLQVLQSQTGITASDIYKALETGLIQPNEAASWLYEIGLNPDLIELGLNRAGIAYEINRTKELVKLAKACYMKHVASKAETYSDLLSIGIISDRANIYVDQWEIERKKKVSLAGRYAPGSKRLRYRQIMDGYGKDVITHERALFLLSEQGYYPEDGEILLQIAKAS